MHTPQPAVKLVLLRQTEGRTPQRSRSHCTPSKFLGTRGEATPRLREKTVPKTHESTWENTEKLTKLTSPVVTVCNSFPLSLSLLPLKPPYFCTIAAVLRRAAAIASRLFSFICFQNLKANGATTYDTLVSLDIQNTLRTPKFDLYKLQEYHFDSNDGQQMNVQVCGTFSERNDVRCPSNIITHS